MLFLHSRHNFQFVLLRQLLKLTKLVVVNTEERQVGVLQLRELDVIVTLVELLNDVTLHLFVSNHFQVMSPSTYVWVLLILADIGHC